MNLFESGAPKVLFHYTNIKSLFLILSDGNLKTREYDIGSHDFGLSGEWKKRKELATIRPSAVSNQKISNVTTKAGKVRIIIQTHKLLDKQRGIKIKPIAEYPLGGIARTKELLINKLNFNKKNAEKITNKIFRHILSDFSYTRKKDNFSAGHKINISLENVRNFLIKELNIKKTSFYYKELVGTYSTNFVYSMKRNIEDFLRWSRSREGEERIIFNNNIPLDSSYLKIELLPRVSFKNFPKTKSFTDTVNTYKDLFVKNSAYRRFIAFNNKIKEELKQKKPTSTPEKKSS